MIRMLIVGYAFAIRSERALCREMRVNLAYRWFCGLSIEDKIPDHSAFSRIRHERFRESDMFRRVFERVVEACIAAGLVGGEGFAVDASLIVADANKQRSIPGTEWKKTCLAETASRATREYLATLDDAAFGAASDVTPKFVSPSDPAAQWTGAMRGLAFFAYADNYLIESSVSAAMRGLGKEASDYPRLLCGRQLAAKARRRPVPSASRSYASHHSRSYAAQARVCVPRAP